jgi:hypothetical protein
MTPGTPRKSVRPAPRPKPAPFKVPTVPAKATRKSGRKK